MTLEVFLPNGSGSPRAVAASNPPLCRTRRLKLARWGRMAKIQDSHGALEPKG